MDEEVKAKHIRAGEEAWNRGNLELLSEVMASGVVTHFPPGPDKVGLDAYKEWIMYSRTILRDFHVTYDKVIFEDGWSGWLGTVECTHVETGKHANVIWTMMMRLEDGKTVEIWHLIDGIGYREQLGLPLATQPVMQPA
ncbi:MAG: ester cyclase [Anaerolineae bacterium]|nr:ester cyclase [Anaerolineae bacterium]